MFNIINSGTKARKNPLILEISTAGFNKSYPFYEQLELGKRILNDELEQDNTFYAFYTLDEEKEIEEPDKWIKSNPTIGTIIDYDTLLEDYNKACKTATDKDDFIIKNLNFYKDVSETWIPDEVYKECFIDYDIENLKGCNVYLGIDLASTRDLTSLAVVFEYESKLFVKVENFLPDNPDSVVRMNGLDLQSWIDKGYITQGELKTTDYNQIKERIKYYTENFNVISLGFDKWNSSQIIGDLQIDLGLYCKECPQNTSFFNYPLRYLEGLIYNKKIVMSKNPVLRWMFRNVVLFRDSNDNIKIMKNKKKDSVDSVVALAMALAMYLESKKYDFKNGLI